ncbi:MAG: serine/threonine protein kinase, partial [Thermoproteota archaeon]
SLKWKTGLDTHDLTASPAIGDDGTVYFTFEENFFAVSPDGTGKWSYLFWDKPGDTVFDPSPAIGGDGTIYLGGDRLRAFDPNGSLKWEYGRGRSNIDISPVVGGDGIVYVSIWKRRYNYLCAIG